MAGDGPRKWLENVVPALTLGGLLLYVVLPLAPNGILVVGRQGIEP